MFNNLTKLFDLVFKGLGIAIMVFTITVVVISVKSCSNMVEVLDKNVSRVKKIC